MWWGDRARLGGGISERTSPEEQLDKNAGLYTADQVSRRCGEGGLLSFVVLFLFLQKCGAARDTGAGTERRGGREASRSGQQR